MSDLTDAQRDELLRELRPLIGAHADVVRNHIEPVVARMITDALLGSDVLAQIRAEARAEGWHEARAELLPQMDALAEVRARVEAVADEWERAADAGGPRNYAGSLFRTAAQAPPRRPDRAEGSA